MAFKNISILISTDKKKKLKQKLKEYSKKGPCGNRTRDLSHPKGESYL